jgi:hypothetical protein
MSNVVIFAAVFIVFFILRAIAATITFYFLLPDGDRCPLCDEPTIRVSEPAWNRLLPWFRTSWCYRCGWEGLLRPVSPPAAPKTESQSGQLPVSSKKSS